MKAAMAVVIATAVLLLAACASIGRPEGGPRDVTPPRFVNSTPLPGALNVSGNRIDILFDENLKLDDPSSKVIVSPAQKEMPKLSALGRHVRVELRDTLLPNTTYTIDFADAIQDLNEGNPLDGFALEFSTGEDLDSLRISGIVLDARTLEPAQGILVGAYSNPADSAITTLPLERIARTNQLGQFTLRGLRDTVYQVFAINDVNRDYHWDRSEDIAFLDSPVRPRVEAITVTDTLRSSTSTDSLVERAGVRFLPNDVLLPVFNEGFKAQYIKDKLRPERFRIDIMMATEADTLPELTIVEGEHAGRRLEDLALRTTSEKLDTLQYWLRDPALIQADTIAVSMRYLRTDSLNKLSWATDTLRLNYREPKSKKKKAETELTDSVAPTKFLTFRKLGQSQHDLNRPLTFEASQPVDSILHLGVHLEMKVDTLWQPVAVPPFTPDPGDPTRLFTISPPQWQEGATYRLTVDSAAVRGIYDHNDRTVSEFILKTTDDYSSLVFNFPTVTDSAMVELLNNSDAVVATAPVANGRAEFRYITPGTYYARMWIDANGNGLWDTGNVAAKTQPEEVNYYPRKLNLKKNWDIEQTWDIFATPVDLQKPYDIKKNKPKLKPGEKAPTSTADEEEDDSGNQLPPNYFDAQYRGTSTNQYDRRR